MSARAMGTGVISFGLVNIPVKVYSALESSGKVGFNQLHAEKKIRLKQQMVDPETGQPVPREQIARGYEYAKDQYVLVSDEELEKLELATSRSMDICEFVPLEAVDPLYFESGYYLGPDKGAERAYRLLAAALLEMKHAAVAQYVARGKQNLILLRPKDGALVMQQLRYADEVRALGEVPIPEARVTDAELQLARQFIGQLARDRFDITAYKDDYKERLKALLEAKVRGEVVDLTPAPAPQAKVVDLMEALKASLARSSTAQSPGTRAAAAPVESAAAQAAPVEAERKPPKRAREPEGGAQAEPRRRRKAQ